MASLTKKSGSVAWIACFTDAAGIQRQRSTGLKDLGDSQTRASTRRKAIEIAQHFEETARGHRTEAQVRRVIADVFTRVNGKRLEFAVTRTFLESWLARVQTRKSKGTHRRYETVVDGFLRSLGAAAEKGLGDVTTEDVQAYFDARIKAGKRGGTLKTEGKILNAAFAYALRQGLVIVNPVPAAELGAHGSESKRPFSWEQVEALVRATDAKQWPKNDPIIPALRDWRTAILVGTFTAARLGDSVNLTWRNIDLTTKLLRFRPRKTRAHAKDLVVPIHPDLEEHLLELPAADAPDAFLTPMLAGAEIGGRGGLSRQFQRIMARAGIENERLGDQPKGGRIFNAYGFHSLRHTSNTELANAGVDQEVRRAVTGHSSATINDIYTHREMKALRGAIDKLPRLKK